MKLTREELFKIAKHSAITLHEDEIESLRNQLETVLTYAARVKEVAQEVQESSTKNVNVFREDVIIRTDYEPILAQAPVREETYFVVPVILENE